jgi:hypothetical protein
MDIDARIYAVRQAYIWRVPDSFLPYTPYGVKEIGDTIQFAFGCSASEIGIVSPFVESNNVPQGLVS